MTSIELCGSNQQKKKCGEILENKDNKIEEFNKELKRKYKEYRHRQIDKLHTLMRRNGCEGIIITFCFRYKPQFVRFTKDNSRQFNNIIKVNIKVPDEEIDEYLLHITNNITEISNKSIIPNDITMKDIQLKTKPHAEPFSYTYIIQNGIELLCNEIISDNLSIELIYSEECNIIN